ncbi:hypothetical protein U9M48_002248 [Paspalum notatum var. saurae]|uniref:Uncharacterized protein n=1 Tax=Paspalum notatum var. saurae TaxID=547442 RepID=A0AAQ3SHB5_PASNO
MDHDIEQGKNMKLISCVFEQLSCLKINFHKSEIFCFGWAKDCEVQYSQLFDCKVGTYPFRYLGIPMHSRKLNNRYWKHIEDISKKNYVGGRVNYFLLVVNYFLLVEDYPEGSPTKTRVFKIEVLLAK